MSPTQGNFEEEGTIWGLWFFVRVRHPLYKRRQVTLNEEGGLVKFKTHGTYRRPEGEGKAAGHLSDELV